MPPREQGMPFRPVLEPGKGIGGLNLGAKVQEVLAIMQKHPDTFGNVEVKFCGSDLLAMDLCIECPDIGMNVICEPVEARVWLANARILHFLLRMWPVAPEK